MRSIGFCPWVKVFYFIKKDMFMETHIHLNMYCLLFKDIDIIIVERHIKKSLDL